MKKTNNLEAINVTVISMAEENSKKNDFNRSLEKAVRLAGYCIVRYGSYENSTRCSSPETIFERKESFNAAADKFRTSLLTLNKVCKALTGQKCLLEYLEENNSRQALEIARIFLEEIASKYPDRRFAKREES